MSKAPLRLPYCPRCMSDLQDMMTRVKYGVVWCHLCSYDLEDMTPSDRKWQVDDAKQRADDE